MEAMDLVTVIDDLQGIKEYINNLQGLQELNLYVLGYRMGIILNEIDKTQEKLIELQKDLINN